MAPATGSLPTSTGTGSPVSIDWSTANARDDDAVGRDLLAGSHDEAIADDELLDQDQHLRAAAEDVRLPGAELEQREDRLARAPSGAGG